MRNQLANSLTVLALCLSSAIFVLEPATAQTGAVRSLRGADVVQSDSAPEERRELGGSPGSQKPIARTFAGQPPLVPHSTAGLGEITLKQNPCFSCHAAEAAKAVGAPAIGKSHYLQQKGKPTGTLDSRRQQCLACHVPQFDAPPLVDNTFRGAR